MDPVDLRRLAHAAETLRQRPEIFTLVPGSLTLRQSRLYLGAYYTLRSDCGWILDVHATVGHWLFAARQVLSPDAARHLLQMIRVVLLMPIRYADAPAEVLENRALITVHVQSGVNNRWWGIQQSARRTLHVLENPYKRKNFHVSVDTLVRPPFPLVPRPLPPPAPPLPPPGPPAAAAGEALETEVRTTKPPPPPELPPADTDTTAPGAIAMQVTRPGSPRGSTHPLVQHVFWHVFHQAAAASAYVATR